MYLGDGHKFEFSKPGYFPIEPPAMCEDAAEYEDGPEPTPLEEPPAEVVEEEEGEAEAEDDD